MGFFECCHYCPVDKRHPGCHDVCPDYKEAKAKWDVLQDTIKRARFEESLTSRVRKAIRLKYKH